MRILMLISALLFTAAAVAQPDPVPTTNPGPHAAAVFGTLGQPSSDIHPIEIIEINGRNLPSGRDTIWLEPGRHTIKVRTFARNPGGLNTRLRDRHEPGHNEIELVLEAGKSYYLGAKFDRNKRRDPYTVVLYRVEE